MNIFDTIIEWFKTKFKLDPERKTEAELMSDFNDTASISITSVLADRLSTLTISDNGISVLGDSARAKYMGEFATWLNETKLQDIATISLGTGDCLARPNTDGIRIGLDIISNDKFVIVNSIGDFLYSVLIKCDEIKKGTDVYERWEYHQLQQTPDGVSYCSITQVAFKNKKEIPLAYVEAWAGLKDMQIVPNVDKLLFGRFKCPKLNRADVNSANGVPITFGNEYIVEQAKDKVRRFNEEYGKSDKVVFADKRVFRSKKVKNSDGTYTEKSVLPKGKESVIMTVNGSTAVDGAPLIHEYNPEIRSTALADGINENLKLLEIFAGLDCGILSDSNNKYVNLDETKKSVQATYAFINRFRKVLQRGMDDLFYAVNVICNFNSITPIGDYVIDYDWSDSYIEDSKERFNQLLQANSIGAVTLAEVRAWVMDIDLDVAEEQISEMESMLDASDRDIEGNEDKE